MLVSYSTEPIRETEKVRAFVDGTRSNRYTPLAISTSFQAQQECPQRILHYLGTFMQPCTSPKPLKINLLSHLQPQACWLRLPPQLQRHDVKCEKRIARAQNPCSRAQKRHKIAVFGDSTGLIWRLSTCNCHEISGLARQRPPVRL